MSAENAKILESLPEPPEFEAYESPFLAHSASPILPSEFGSNPEPLALFNLFFGNDILAQIITNTNCYAEIKQQTAESHPGPPSPISLHRQLQSACSKNTSSFIPKPACPPVPPSILHSEPVLHLPCQPIPSPPAVNSHVPPLSTPDTHPLPRAWCPVSIGELQIFIGLQIWMGVHSLPAIEDYWNQEIQHPIMCHMSCNRYKQIKCYFHISPPDET